VHICSDPLLVNGRLVSVLRYYPSPFLNCSSIIRPHSLWRTRPRIRQRHQTGAENICRPIRESGLSAGRQTNNDDRSAFLGGKPLSIASGATSFLLGLCRRTL
jgi:hypothetical protein